MRLHLSFALEFGNESGDLLVNDWAKDWAGKIGKQNQDEQIRDQKFLEIQKLKRQFGPKIWADMRAALESKCNSLNEEMRQSVLMFEFTRHGEISIVGCLRGKRKELRIVFDAEAGLLKWNVDERTSDSAHVAISEDGTGAYFTWGVAANTPEQISRRMLNAFLESFQ